MYSMTALPVDDYDPDDPVEILRVLPGRRHRQFLAEYQEAVAGARRPEQYQQLHQLLRLWRLSAVAFSDRVMRTGSGRSVTRAGGEPGRRSRILCRTGMSGSRLPGAAAGSGELPA